VTTLNPPTKKSTVAATTKESFLVCATGINHFDDLNYLIIIYQNVLKQNNIMMIKYKAINKCEILPSAVHQKA